MERIATMIMIILQFTRTEQFPRLLELSLFGQRLLNGFIIERTMIMQMRSEPTGQV